MLKWPTLRFGFLAFVVCIVSLTLYLAMHHQIGALVAFRAVASLYFLGVIPGYIVLRYIARIQTLSHFETLLSSLVLGSLLTPGLWYLLCWLGVSLVFWPMVIGGGFVLPVVFGWHRRIGERLGTLVAPRDVPILFVALAMVVLWSYTIQFVDIQADQVAIKPHYDLSYHAIQTAELARGVPAERLPFLSTGSRIAYHHLPDVWSDLIRRAAGTDPHTSFFHLALPLRYLLLSVAAYLGLVTRFGRWAALAGVICLLAFVEPARFSFPKSFLYYLHYSYPTTFGLMLIFLMLHYASHIHKQNRRRVLTLICFLAGLIVYYKANQALVVVPAATIFAIWLLARARDSTGIAICIIAMGLPLTLMRLETVTANVTVPLEFSPGAFVSWWWDRLLLPGGAKETIHSLVETLPAIARWPIVFAICVVQRFHFGIMILVYMIARCGWARNTSERKYVDLLVCSILISCTVGFILLPIQRNLVWNVAMHTWAVPSALFFALMGPAIYDLVRRIFACRRRAILAAAFAVMVGACAYNAVALRRVALWETSGSSGYVSVPFYDCCRYIQKTTPADSVVLHPLYRENLFASLLTERRSAFEYAWLCSHFVDTEAIIAELDDLYAGVDENAIRLTLLRLGVDYVIAGVSSMGGPAKGPLLIPIFHSGDMAVYRVNRTSLTSTDGAIPTRRILHGGTPALVRRDPQSR